MRLQNEKRLFVDLLVGMELQLLQLADSVKLLELIQEDVFSALNEMLLSAAQNVFDPLKNNSQSLNILAIE